MAGSDEKEATLVPRPADPLQRADADEDLPVVSRLMIEIRSDGSRTVVRGRMEDHSGDEPQAVQMEARAATPVELVKTLTRALVDVMRGGPASLGTVIRGLLPGRRRE
jgi:hypothetical protein